MRDFYEVAVFDVCFRRMLACSCTVKVCRGKRPTKQDVMQQRKWQNRTDAAKKRAIAAGYTEQEIGSLSGFSAETYKRACNEVYGVEVVA